VSDQSFIETSNFTRSHAIIHDQQSKERSGRQIHNTYQSRSTVTVTVTGTTKKHKIKTVLVSINKLQDQDSSGSDDELNTPTLYKTSMVCKLAQVAQEIWMTVPIEAKKWF
jgi:hypothetical protein